MYVQDLEQQLVEKERKLDEVYAAFRSSQAETSRIRERLERDREKRILQEKVRLFSRILEPLDNLERSLDAAQKAGEDTKLAAGLVMVHRQICDALFSLGLQRTDPTGQKFDPTRHEAVSVAAVTDEAQHDTVVTCVQPGYVIGDQLVRAARVIVGRKS
jgi:molecular chaperone GrpE